MKIIKLMIFLSVGLLGTGLHAMERQAAIRARAQQAPSIPVPSGTEQPLPQLSRSELMRILGRQYDISPNHCIFIDDQRECSRPSPVQENDSDEEQANSLFDLGDTLLEKPTINQKNIVQPPDVPYGQPLVYGYPVPVVRQE